MHKLIAGLGVAFVVGCSGEAGIEPFSTTRQALGAPTVTSAAASPVTGTSATLNGSANPNGEATTGWFRYSTTSPGVCNDGFGTRVPASGGTDLQSGSAAVAFSQAITGLTPGVTYTFCAIASNPSGTSFGQLLTFTTPTPPTATTTAATLITDGAATLNGSGNPNGSSTTAHFRYSGANPGTCSDTFGSRLPSSESFDSNLGSGTSPTAYSQSVTGLGPAATYFFCAITTSAAGTTFGALQSFTTLPAAPAVNTSSSNDITSSTASLNGFVNPGGAATTTWFRYSTTSPGTCNDTFGTRAPAAAGTVVPAGLATVGFSQSITGLAPGTVYYFCAIAQNTAGTSFGLVQSLTTALAPAVTTQAASSVTNLAATLNALANPNGVLAAGWFRFATTNPVTCNDTFGTRAPAMGSTTLGSGSSFVSLAQTLTGLTPATTYFFCAIASSSEGTTLGAVLSFTTASAPTATTAAATLVTASTATLNGSGAPSGGASTGFFRYATTNPGTCDDTFGTRAPALPSSDSSLGSGATAVVYARALTGLQPGTPYFFCAITTNGYGTTFGAVLSFTTLAAAPTVTSGTATNIGGTSATLNATANPNGAATTAWFRFSTASPGTCDDTFGTRAPLTGGSALPSGNTAGAFSQTASGLTPGTTYFYCAIAQNGPGTSVGLVRTFTTALPPLATTQAASNVTTSSATLNGGGNPNGASTTGWFRFATTNPGTCNDTFGTRAPMTGVSSLGSGSSLASYSQAVSGLSPSTTYFVCAIVSSTEGTAFGAPLSFTTAAAPPVVSTLAPTLVTPTTATATVSVNPNGQATTVWVRSSTTNPGGCNDTFGTRTPSTAGVTAGAGFTATSVEVPLSSLAPSTTYFVCALAQNATGTTAGNVVSFTTPSAPVVTTQAATLVTSTGASLGASVNPGGSQTTLWFRHATMDPGSCNDTFGTRLPATGGVDLGTGTTAIVSLQPVTGLTAGTTSFVCAIAQNAWGTTVGNVVSFTTAPAAPVVSTNATTSPSATGATLNGSAVANGAATTAWFRYSMTNPGVCDDMFGTRAPATGGTALGAGGSVMPFSETLTGLTPGTTWFVCALAQNAAGLGLGTVESFTTAMAPLRPTVVTSPATLVLATGATLNGSANPNGQATTAWFRYATTSPAACDDTFGTRLPATAGTALGSGSSAASFTEALPNLVPGTTYFFCAIAENATGLAFGTVSSFVTGAAAPVVTTTDATRITSAAATIAGTVEPRGSDALVWFRLGDTAAAACSDAFGTRTPAAGGVTVDAGMGATPVTFDLTGLAPKRTYFYCAAASNLAGAAFGGLRTFATPATPPTVTTQAVELSGDSVIFRATANPNGSETSGWFRHATTKPTSCDDTFGAKVPSAGVGLGAGRAAAPFSETVTGLPEGTSYICAIASNEAGLGFGEVQSITITPKVEPEPKACGCGVEGSGLAWVLVVVLLVLRRS